MSKRAEAAALLLGLLAVAVALTWPLALHLRTQIAADTGDPLYAAWALGWDADRIRHGLRGVFDAPNFYPYRGTLLYSEHMLGIAVFTAPLQWLTGNAVLVYNAGFIASFVFAGAAMYLLARELTGRRDAALIAGAIYACDPLRAAYLSHLQLLVTGWLPLGLWALHRYANLPTARWLLLAAICYVLQVTTSSYFAYYALPPLAIVALVEIRRARVPVATVFRTAAPAVALCAIVLAPIVLGYSTVRSEQGQKRSVEDIAQGSADVADYFTASARLRLWGGLGNGRDEHELFPGVVALALGGAGLVFGWRRSNAVPLYAAVLAVGVLLTLGPAPAAWGHRPGVPGPYSLLLKVVPGLDGLRAPARQAVVVHLALAVLAAFGSARLLDQWRSPALRGAAIAFIIGAIAAEGWAAPIPAPPVWAGPLAARDAYAFLKRLPAGAAIEFPTAVDEPIREYSYQFATLLHGHPVVNGQSGYTTPLLSWLGGGHSPLRESGREADTLSMLRTIGVRYVVLHRDLYADQALADGMVAAFDRETSQVAGRRTFGETTVATLLPLDVTPSPGEGLADVPPGAMTATASAGSDRIAMLFDGDVDSRWLTGGHQSGEEWLALQFDRPRDVGLVRLQLGVRSFGDYPRRLVVEAVEEGGTRTLFDGPGLPLLARGILGRADYPFLDVLLPANRSSSIRLLQRGSTNAFFWSVHELRVRERL